MAEEWLSSESIDVDVDQLIDFAQHIQAELEKNFRPSYEQGIRPMLTVQAPFGAGMMKEAQFFRGRHDESRSSAASMLGEAMQGLMSLSMGARSIAAEYRNGDAFAKATHDDVFGAFDKLDGKKTLQDYAKEGSGGKPVDDYIPEEAKTASGYFVDKNQDGIADGDKSSTMYGQTIIAENKAGEYVIPADDDQTTAKKYDVSTPYDAAG